MTRKVFMDMFFDLWKDAQEEITPTVSPSNLIIIPFHAIKINYLKETSPILMFG